MQAEALDLYFGLEGPDGVGSGPRDFLAAATPERLRDNALFTAFAPADKPRIAIAVVVENAGFGATTAAPIVRKALDYYLLGKRPGDKTKVPVPKEDVDVLPVEAPAGVTTEFKPGGETPGNKE